MTLDDNQISDISALSGLTSLEFLFLNNNQI
ncbi:MAG: leucine-rich repeat domain-containing protein, partial [Proteobacteria bacterium]|nr:leucine-rich repeat domain-containing protein [Pseudomonadota bacterium]